MTADKPYTVVVLLQPRITIITAQLNAHCQSCAFIALLQILHERKAELTDAKSVHVMAILDGHHLNLWPEVEIKIKKLGVDAQNLPMPNAPIEWPKETVN